uniref:MATH domain-containing protein n=1 Tax=Panagrolaimus davidi TaxID=227884 RepID=A0A914QXJ7_9BILA
MEISVSKIPINQEIKLKKSDLKALEKPHSYLSSSFYCVCNISNVKYFISIYPNLFPGQILIHLYVISGNAIWIETELEYSITSANFSKNIKWNCKKFEKNDSWIRVNRDCYDTKKNIFNKNDVIVVKINGFFKIGLQNKKSSHPISIQMKIKEKDLKEAKMKNAFLKSKKFKLSSDSDIKYFLEIDPDFNGGKTWLFFYLTPKIEAKLNLNFSIKSQNCSNFSNYDEYCSTYICTIEDLFNPNKGYFIDGEMILKITGNVLIENESNEISNEKNVISTKK